MTPEQQFEVLSRGTEEILPEGALLERLRTAARDGRPLRVKQGFDPTAPDIHLGHAVGLRKLREFQDLGHQVVLIVGDYTGLVGDPSGRNKTRPDVGEQQLESNARTYLEQFHTVVERAPQAPRLPVEIHRNSEWFQTMGLKGVLALLRQYTVSQVLEREDFSKRFAAEQPIGLHELLYPLMQGYDSVAIRADVELGATEQKFNLLVGRELQKLDGQPQQIVLTVPVLPGLDGVQRMSKSVGNYIGVTDAPRDMYGKVMSLPDAAMPVFWRLAAALPAAELAAIENELKAAATHPMTLKKRLAERIVALYHGGAAAAQAASDFDTQFTRREVPDDLEEFSRADVTQALGNVEVPTIVEFLVGSRIAASKSAARRLVEAGAVSVDGERVKEGGLRPDPGSAHVIKAGRKMKRYKP